MLQNARILSILSAVVCDSEADVEGVYSLTASDAALIVEALCSGLVQFRVAGATCVGSPPFTITGIEMSIDGTNYITWITFGTAVTCNAAVELGLRAIAATSPFDHRTTKLRLVMGGSAPDGSNKLTVTAQVVVYLPSK